MNPTLRNVSLAACEKTRIVREIIFVEDPLRMMSIRFSQRRGMGAFEILPALRDARFLFLVAVKVGMSTVSARPFFASKRPEAFPTSRGSSRTACGNLFRDDVSNRAALERRTVFRSIQKAVAPDARAMKEPTRWEWYRSSFPNIRLYQETFRIRKFERFQRRHAQPVGANFRVNGIEQRREATFRRRGRALLDVRCPVLAQFGTAALF
jgi:hypothetical protein